MSVAASSTEEAEALRLAQRAHEPSMEEILASIRAIIADDREPASKSGPQIVYSSDAPRPPAAAPTVVWTREAPAAAEAPPEADPEPEPESEPESERYVAEALASLVSQETESAVSGSFQVLSESLTAHGFEIAEQMAREMLRPMLKAWLDEHLPATVERLVRAEIQRLAKR